MDFAMQAVYCNTRPGVCNTNCILQYQLYIAIPGQDFAKPTIGLPGQDFAIQEYCIAIQCTVYMTRILQPKLCFAITNQNFAAPAVYCNNYSQNFAAPAVYCNN